MIKKIKEESIVNGFEVGNLKIVIQGVPDGKTGRIIKGVFCTLNVKKEDKKESINFVLALDSVPDFKKHILSMINQAIELHSKKDKKVINK
jgi:hypothetical protein